jgi:hypothetical protein
MCCLFSQKKIIKLVNKLKLCSHAIGKLYHFCVLQLQFSLKMGQLQCFCIQLKTLEFEALSIFLCARVQNKSRLLDTNMCVLFKETICYLVLSKVRTKSNFIVRNTKVICRTDICIPFAYLLIFSFIYLFISFLTFSFCFCKIYCSIHSIMRAFH